MEELNKNGVMPQVEEESSFNLKDIYTMLILHWPWILLSVILCTGLAYVYIRYATPVFQANAKMLIKDDENNMRSRGANALMNTANLGFMTNSTGIDNEMEILGSHSISESVVQNLKLYVNYWVQGRLNARVRYGNQPVTVDLDAKHLKELKQPIKLEIVRKGDNYQVTGLYKVEVGEERQLEKRTVSKSFNALPASINIKPGLISFTKNPDGPGMKDGDKEIVIINPIEVQANKYVKALNIAQTGKLTTIANITLTDEDPQRALDFLENLAETYNRQANDDKNEIAVRTEKFINSRLEKINKELGTTEGAIEDFKKQNNLVDVPVNAAMNMQNANEYDQKLVEMETQIALLNSVGSFVNMPSNRYQTLPSNVGLTDASATTLINKYNELVMERNYLLRTASESNDAVLTLTQQLDEMLASIKRALSTAKQNLTIQRNALSTQASRFLSDVRQTPQQERVMGEIGRQREVQIALYSMLLQKREENSISLAATADKGRLIDKPSYTGQVKPKKPMIMLAGGVLGLAIPFGILFLINFFRYKVEGHDDVTSITNIPIIADVAVASSKVKKKADIVVHENTNNMMEEIFRTMRTNVQFMLKEGQKVIMVTSSISGEGKTFNAANLAVCFALLGKKVCLVGLDIRKPRLAELFEINDYRHGITNLLVKEHITWEDTFGQMLPSGVNDNLNLLMAGPIPPNPAELIVRSQLDQVIDHLKEHYDYVLLDTAPVGLVTDSLHLTRLADITVVVCRADYTPKADIQMLDALTKEGKLKNTALVINGIDMSKKKYGMAYGYGKYGRYGKYGHYGKYGRGSSYGTYGNYSQSHYGVKNDDSIKG